MRLNKKFLSIMLIASMTTGALSLSAASLTKTAKLFYNNIRVKVDGQYQPTNVEPFMIDGTVYVSLRDAAQLTNNKVNWNKMDQSVEISTGQYKPSDYEQELASKNAEIMQLRSQLKKLQDEIENDKPTTSDQEDENSKLIERMLKSLEKEYSRSHNIEWDFDLEEDDGTLLLEVSYDGYYDQKDFNKMSNTTVENFVQSICKFIHKEYGSIDIEGQLYNTDNNEKISEFSYTKKGKYKYTKINEDKFTEEQLKEFEKELKGDYENFPEIDFSGEYDGKSIRVKDIQLTHKDDSIVYEIYTTFMDTFNYIWNGLEEGSATTKLENYMDDIQEEIEDEFDVNYVKGYLYNAEGDLMAEYRDGDLKIKKIN